MIAIANIKGSFSDRWIAYCDSHGIDYKLVDPYSTDIMISVRDCDAFMWHHNHANYRDVLFAKQLLYSLEYSGLKVFPDKNTTWFFDDKVGQKYLLEAIDAPLVPSFVFYDKKNALSWAKNVSYPKVFKLRCGAGSSNVKLVYTYNNAVRLITKAFGRGFSQFDRIEHLKDCYFKFKIKKNSLFDVCKSIGRLFFPTEFAKMHPREKGYVYFQDFIPDNKFDIRIIVIGNKAFGIKRLTRENDFRASGSGVISYDKDQIDERCVKIAFEVNRKLETQCIGYDFVFHDNKPLIVEIGYGFIARVYDLCEGFWDENIQWHKGQINPCGWMIESVQKKSSIWPK